MIVSRTQLRAGSSTAARAGLLILTVLAGCAHWPSIETPVRDDLAGLTQSLEAPEPDQDAATKAEIDVEELTQAESDDTELGAPGPFPQPARPRTSIPASTSADRRRVPIVDVTPAPSWQEAGRSHENRPIEAIRFGSQAEDRILVVASLAGSDPESVLFVDRLVTRLSRVEALRDGSANVSALLIRSPNPDGLAGHFSTNSRGVELNRNFPSPRFPVTRTTRTGPEPGSEPETQALMKLLEDFRPTRVVHVRPGSGSQLLLLCENQYLRPMTEKCSDMPINVACHDGDFKAGSIEEYCRGQWAADIITIYLPGLQSMADSDELLRGVAHACLSVDLPEVVVDDPDGLAAQQASTSETRPDGEFGYVEALPPPESHADAPQDARYYELPPPPE